MKKRVFLRLALLMPILFAFCQGKTPDNTKIFIGYCFGTPVFDSYKEKKIYSYNEKLVLLEEYPQAYTVLKALDSITALQQELPNGKFELLLRKGGLIYHKFQSNSRFTFMAINGDTIAFTDLSDHLRIKLYSPASGIVETKASGYVTAYFGSHIYYTSQQDLPDGSTKTDIHKYNLADFTSKRILENISGEETVISPSERFIYDKVLREGEWNPIIFNIESRLIKNLVINKTFLNATPYFNLKQHSLTFYNPSTLVFFDVPLE